MGRLLILWTCPDLALDEAIVVPVQCLEGDGLRSATKQRPLLPARLLHNQTRLQRGGCRISASGKTPFTIAAIETARAQGVLTIGVANNPETPLLAAAEYPILLHTGAEALAGSTRMKAGTAQKICLNLISTLIMVRMGRVKKGMMSQMQATNAKLRHRQTLIDAALNKTDQ